MYMLVNASGHQQALAGVNYRRYSLNQFAGSIPFAYFGYHLTINQDIAHEYTPFVDNAGVIYQLLFRILSCHIAGIF